MGRSYPKIIAIEIGHLSPTTLSGGDKLLLDLMPYIKDLPFRVIIPVLANGHWHKYSSHTIQILPNNYLLRILHTVTLLHSLLPTIIISNTNYYPDVFAAALYKLTHPKVYWIARILHLVSPSRRLPYAVQIICLFLSNTFANLSLALNSHIYDLLSTSKKDLLPAGINFSHIQAIKPSPAHYDCVFVGRLHHSKGINDLPKIMDFLPDTTLAVIGEGSVPWTHPHITILGRVSDHEKFSILKSAKIFLCSDHEAGWGLAIAEAMACGLPIVGYDLPIFSTVFSQGFVTVPLGNTSQFAGQITTILQNPELRKKLSKLALAQAKKLSLSIPARKFKIILDASVALTSKN